MNKKQITNKLNSSFYRPKKKKASSKEEKKEGNKELEEMDKKIEKATRGIRDTIKSLTR